MKNDKYKVYKFNIKDGEGNWSNSTIKWETSYQ